MPQNIITFLALVPVLLYCGMRRSGEFINYATTGAVVCAAIGAFAGVLIDNDSTRSELFPGQRVSTEMIDLRKQEIANYPSAVASVEDSRNLIVNSYGAACIDILAEIDEELEVDVKNYSAVGEFSAAVESCGGEVGLLKAVVDFDWYQQQVEYVEGFDVEAQQAGIEEYEVAIAADDEDQIWIRLAIYGAVIGSIVGAVAYAGREDDCKI